VQHPGELFTTEIFDVSIAERRAICPVGHASVQCSRLENHQTGPSLFSACSRVILLTAIGSSS
jgi:hypothetical protein